MSPALLQKQPVDDRPPLRIHTPPAQQYAPFGNVEARNDLQARLEIPTMLLALGLPLGGRVLEVGCGRGVALPVLNAGLLPNSLIGLDIDPALIQEAERRIQAHGVHATLIEGDVRDIPLASSSVDLVVDFGTCYHVGGGVDGSRLALGEIARVLRTDGLFVHETPVAQHLAHPVRSFGRTLPWTSVPVLARDRSAVLWAVRRKRAWWVR
ncbi:MAG: Methyltransferase type 11 [Gemmatimonadetes bacterium]|nr:Methyltransferase type 11 [Gemmatimonadota bacterium]